MEEPHSLLGRGRDLEGSNLERRSRKLPPLEPWTESDMLEIMAEARRGRPIGESGEADDSLGKGNASFLKEQDDDDSSQEGSSLRSGKHFINEAHASMKVSGRFVGDA